MRIGRLYIKWLPRALIVPKTGLVRIHGNERILPAGTPDPEKIDALLSQLGALRRALDEQEKP